VICAVMSPTVLLNFRIYLDVKTCEVFLCFIAVVRVRVYYIVIHFFVFFALQCTSLVSAAGSYTEDEPSFDVQVHVE